MAKMFHVEPEAGAKTATFHVEHFYFDPRKRMARLKSSALRACLLFLREALAFSSFLCTRLCFCPIALDFTPAK